MIKEIVTCKKQLSIPCENFDFEKDDAKEFAEMMTKNLFQYRGIGLAANQIGYNVRVFAMIGSPNIFVCFNPRIVEVGQETIVMEEGCLSFQGLKVKIKRPKSIKIRFFDYEGNASTHTFTGMTARIVQHEMDHLDGVLFYDRANRYYKEKAFKKWKKATLKKL